MNRYEECADLCDDQGFIGAASLLRSIAGGTRLTCHMLVESKYLGDAYDGPPSIGPRLLFLDRRAAEEAAHRIDVALFRVACLGQDPPAEAFDPLLWKWLSVMPTGRYQDILGMVCNRIDWDQFASKSTDVQIENFVKRLRIPAVRVVNVTLAC